MPKFTPAIPNNTIANPQVCNAVAEARARAGQYEAERLKYLKEKIATTTAPGIAQAPVVDLSQNNYSNEGKNYVVNGDGAQALNLQFQPNLLDNYDSATYHWKLFIVTPEAASSGEIFNTDTQIIIAESGVSDLTIDKVELHTLTTPSIQAGTGTATNVKFTVVEPVGAGLIDQIFYQSLALGIGNWNVMPFYLQLQFKSRDPATSEANTIGTSEDLSSLRWVWALKLTGIAADVTTVGTRYDFEAIIYNEYAQGNAVFTSQHPIVLDAIDTFQNAMTQLQTKLNEDQIYKLIDNNSIPDVFKIVVDGNLAGIAVTPDDYEQDPQRSGSTKTLNKKTLTFSAPTAIDKVIDSILSQTKKYQESMLGAETPGGEGKPSGQQIDQMKKFWKIVTETRPLKFDPRRNDYAREYTIFIVEYELGVVESNVLQGYGDAAAERKRLMGYVNRGILKKRYDYIFTGLNDQIYKFDIKINNAFAVALSRMGGVYSNAAAFDKGPVNQDKANDQAEATKQLGETIALLNSATASEIDKAVAVDKAYKSIETADVPDAEKERLINVLDYAKNPDRLARLQEETAAISGTPEDRLDRARLRNRFLGTPRRETVTQENLNFISDVEQGAAARDKVAKQFTDNVKGKLRPIARIDGMHVKQTGLGVESSSNSGIQKLSSMFAVALHSGLDASFQRTTINIKGDPFWLFPQPIIDTKDRIFNTLKDPAVAIANIKRAQVSLAGTVNIYGSDNFIIIRFRTPRVYDIETNPESNNEFTDVETFSGVFKVLSVTHRFENGRFSQDLECILDPFINILDYMNQLEQSAAVTLTPLKPQDLVATNNTIPDTAVKTNRVGIPSVTQEIQNASNSIAARANTAKDKATSAIASRVGTEKGRATSAVGGGRGYVNPPNIGPAVSSNIPTAESSLIPGLPPYFAP